MITSEQLSLYHEGIKLFKAEKDQEAQEKFETLLEQMEDQNFYFYSTRVYLLKILHETQQFESLLTTMQAYSSQYPDIEQLPALWVLRGVWAKANLEYELAIDCFLKALHMAQEEEVLAFNVELEQEDIDWKPSLGLAEVYFSQERFDDAFPFFMQALKAKPDHQYIVACAVKSGFRSGNFRQIIPLLEQINDSSYISELLIDPLRVATLIFVRQIRQVYDLDLEAITTTLWNHLEELLSIDEFSIHVVMEYAFSLLHIQSLDWSRRIILRLIELIPNHVLLWHNLAYSYFVEKNYQKAEQFYLEALNANPLFVYSRFDLGKVYVMQEQTDKALIEFEQILEHEPDFKKAELAIKQLKEKK